MTIWEETRRVYEELREIRHALHRHPELGHREIWTTQAIRGWLEQWEGIQVLDYGFPTGLAARIQGGRPGGLLALREDIDALPIQERTGLPFASECPGVSHACGHDIHTAALLGCAKLLARRRGDLQGSVLLIFQCAEETFDGAAAMLEQGLFREQVPDAVWGFTVRRSSRWGRWGSGGDLQRQLRQPDPGGRGKGRARRPPGGLRRPGGDERRTSHAAPDPGEPEQYSHRSGCAHLWGDPWGDCPQRDPQYRDAAWDTAYTG